MDDIMDMLSGVDKKNEIFNLWYEVTFVRLVLCFLVSKSQYLQSELTPEVLDMCRKQAQDVVKERFPLLTIDFSEQTPEQVEKRKKHFENLKFINKLMGLKSENEQESPCCTHPDSSKSPTSSPPPSNEA